MSNRLLDNRVVGWFLPESIRVRGGLDELRARLIPVFTGGLVIAGIVFCLVYGWVFGMEWAVWIIVVGLLSVSLTPLLMRQSERIGPASHWISFNFYAVLLGLSLLTGGLEAPALQWMVAVPVYVLVFSGAWPALVWTAVVLATFVGFYYSSALGLPVVQQLSVVQMELLQVFGLVGLALLVVELFVFYGWMHRWLIGELRAAHEQLEDDDRRKNHFLAMLGHELRNPFSSVANSVEVLKYLPTSERVDEQVALMSRQTDALGRMLDDLLDIARITEGSFELKREYVDLNEAVRSALETIEGQFDSSTRTIRCELSPEPVWIYGDRVRLEQIFSNLLTNAFKYTDPGGEIRIAMNPDGEYAHVRIEDDGQGLTDQEVDRVFEMFERGRAPTYDATGGLGVGLTVVKRLVELHGGRVRARSAGKNRGSAFVVQLPVSQYVPEAVESHRGVPRGEVSHDSHRR